MLVKSLYIVHAFQRKIFYIVISYYIVVLVVAVVTLSIERRPVVPKKIVRCNKSKHKRTLAFSKSKKSEEFEGEKMLIPQQFVFLGTTTEYGHIISVTCKQVKYN